MEFTRFNFDKVWTDPEDFPTVETSEEAVRADMQELPDELAAGLNGLMAELETAIVNSLSGPSNSKIPTTKAVADAMASAGDGDMMKASYDTTNTGNKVDTARNAEKLGGQAPGAYQLALTFDSKPTAGSNNPVTSKGILNNGSEIINALPVGANAPADADYFISQKVNGGADDHTYYRRPLSALWTYIRGKIVGDAFPASIVTVGTLAGRVSANATAATALNTAQVRDIYAGTSVPETIPAGALFLLYEE